MQNTHSYGLGIYFSATFRGVPSLNLVRPNSSSFGFLCRRHPHSPQLQSYVSFCRWKEWSHNKLIWSSNDWKTKPISFYLAITNLGSIGLWHLASLSFTLTTMHIYSLSSPYHSLSFSDFLRAACVVYLTIHDIHIFTVLIRTVIVWCWLKESVSTLLLAFVVGRNDYIVRSCEHSMIWRQN